MYLVWDEYDETSVVWERMTDVSSMRWCVTEEIKGVGGIATEQSPTRRLLPI